MEEYYLPPDISKMNNFLFCSRPFKMCGICAVFNLNGSNNGGGMGMKVTLELFHNI